MADARPGGGEALKVYWVSGPGAVKVRWNTPGDFDRCVRAVTEAVTKDGRTISPGVVKGFCSNAHLAATGVRPGQHPGQGKGS